MGLKRTVGLALFAAVLAYYVYNPLPANIEQPLLYSTVTSLFRIIEDLGKVSEMLGYKELLHFRRDALTWSIALFSPPLESYTDINITDAIFDGVPVRIYKSIAGDDGANAAFVYVHGGGYVLSSVDFCDDYLVKIVRATQVTIVSIEYRLGPEHPRPAQLHDCEAATRYLFTNTEMLGVDSQRIGIGGDSAGGNMAAALSLKFRDAGSNPQFAYQVLIYPWLQAMDFNLPSFLENDAYNRPDMKQRGMALYTLGYLGVDRSNARKLQLNQHISETTRVKYSTLLDTRNLGYEPFTHTVEHGVDEDLAKVLEPLVTDPYTFPLMAKNVRGVPPALVVTVGLDPLRDEGLLYLNRLKEAGVNTKHYNDDNCWHGSLNFADGPLKFECGARLLEHVIKYIDHAKDEHVSGNK